MPRLQEYMHNILYRYAQKTSMGFVIIAEKIIASVEKCEKQGVFCAIALSPAIKIVLFLSLLVKIYKPVKKYLLT